MYGKHTPDAAAVTPGYGITAVYTAVLYLGTGITNIYRQNNRTSNSKSKLTKKAERYGRVTRVLEGASVFTTRSPNAINLVIDFHIDF